MHFLCLGQTASMMKKRPAASESIVNGRGRGEHRDAGSTRGSGWVSLNMLEYFLCFNTLLGYKEDWCAFAFQNEFSCSKPLIMQYANTSTYMRATM